MYALDAKKQLNILTHIKTGRKMKNNLKEVYIFLLLTMQASCVFGFTETEVHNILIFVSSFTPKSPIILEAGGRFGEDTIRIKSIWPDAQIHVFEPLPSSFKKLSENTAALTGVLRYPYALSTYSGKTQFYIDPSNPGASSIGHPVEWNENEFDKTPIEVPCITLDDWAQANNIHNIDFMWLDMEGHELYALQHATSILSNVKAIYTEISYKPIRQNSCLYKDLRAFLEQNGFQEVSKATWPDLSGDALFIKNGCLK